MLEVKDLKKYYKAKGGAEVHALDGVSIEFPETGMVFLLGKSGSGKSTLLNVAGGLDKPDSGEIIVKGKSSKDFSQSDFDSYRNTFVGFIFQEYNILSEFNIENNIGLALELQGKKNDKAEINRLLETVDLKGLGKRKPNTLSGGQKQRIAIARALIKEPEIIMADEPTGALDSNTGKQVFDTLKKLSKTKLVIVVSHDRDFAEIYGDRVIELKDGKIISDREKKISTAKEINANIKKIGEDTIQIKNISKLSNDEIAKMIREFSGNGEAIFSANKENIDSFKKVAKIDDNGGQQFFADTDLTKVDIKKYDGKDTKFISSKLPMRHAIKIGASNLKIKPGRLIATIFLSVVAFTMFGILSTLMLYNPAYSYSRAAQDEAYQALKLNKNYTMHVESYKVNNDGNEELDSTYDTEYNTNCSKQDVQNLNNNEFGLKFAGYYDAPVNFSSYLKQPSEIDYYSQSSLYGLCDCGEQYLFDLGYTKEAGHYPQNENEIAVSSYTYELFKKCSYFNVNTSVSKKINNPNDLVGLTLKFNIGNYMSTKILDMTISGVYSLDNPMDDEKYEVLKKEDTSSVSEKDLSELLDSFEDVYKSSYSGLGYVSDSFYSKYKECLKKYDSYNEEYIDPDYIYGFRYVDYRSYHYYKLDPESNPYNFPQSNYDSFGAYSLSKFNSNKDKINVYDLEGNAVDNPSIGAKDAYINISSIANEFSDILSRTNSSKYSYFDAEGEMHYYTPIYPDGSCPFYINYSNGEISFISKSGFEEYHGEAIVDENNKLVLYTRGVYANNDCLDYKLESESGYDYRSCWFDKDGNILGSYDDIETIDYSIFFYDKVNNKVYNFDDVDYSNEKGYYLKSNPTILLKESTSNIYSLDDEGKIEDETNYRNAKIGFFIDKTTGKASLSKTANSVYDINCYKDRNGKIYFGSFVNQANYIDRDGTIQYSFNHNFGPTGVLDADFYLSQYTYYLDGNEETIASFARVLNEINYFDSSWMDRYPDFDFQAAVAEPVTSDDFKVVFDTYKKFAEENSYEENLFNDKFAIFGMDHSVTEMSLKGFFSFKKGVSGYSELIVADSWVEKSKQNNPDAQNTYTWKEKKTTSYVVDENAQYDGLIVKTNKTTEEVNFLMKSNSDDSYYRVNNMVFNKLDMVASMLQTLKTVFLIVGIVMAVFSGLMLLNFISNSISSKQKEIGILRAVGARGLDVFKIYFSEAGIICGICFIISSILSKVGCIIVEQEVAEGLHIALFDFGVLNILIILAVSLFVGLLGTFFPVFKASRKAPVESIRSL